MIDLSIIAHIINDSLGVFGPLLLLIISIVAITRNTRHMQLLAFPLSLLYSKLGINYNIVILIALGVLWGVTIVGTRIIGGVLTSTRETAKEIYNATDYAMTRAEKAKIKKDLQEAAYKDKIDELSMPYRWDKSLRDATFTDALDEYTTPYQVKKGVRTYRTGIDVEKETRSDADIASIQDHMNKLRRRDAKREYNRMQQNVLEPNVESFSAKQKYASDYNKTIQQFNKRNKGFIESIAGAANKPGRGPRPKTTPYGKPRQVRDENPITKMLKEKARELNEKAKTDRIKEYTKIYQGLRPEEIRILKRKGITRRFK